MSLQSDFQQVKTRLFAGFSYCISQFQFFSALLREGCITLSRYFSKSEFKQTQIQQLSHVAFAFTDAPATKNRYRPKYDDSIVDAVSEELSAAGYAYVRAKIETLARDPNGPLVPAHKETALYYSLKRRYFKTAMWLLSHPQITLRTCEQTYFQRSCYTDAGILAGQSSPLIVALMHNYQPAIEVLYSKGVRVTGEGDVEGWARTALQKRFQPV